MAIGHISVTSQGAQGTGSRPSSAWESPLRPHLLPLLNRAAPAPPRHGAEAPLPTRGNSSRRLLQTRLGAARGMAGPAGEHRTRLCRGARPGHGWHSPGAAALRARAEAERAAPGRWRAPHARSPVPAVGGARRDAVDVDIGLHAENGLVLQLGRRHVGREARPGASGGSLVTSGAAHRHLW